MDSISKKLRDVPFSNKITGFMILSLLALAVVTFGVISLVLTNQAGRDAEARQEINMRVAWDVLSQYGDEFSARGGELYIGDQRLAGFYEPADRIKKLVGGSATIFYGDTRVATNVTKPDGSRAVGTKLTDEAVRDAVLIRGEPYRGEAEILGVPHFTAYDPIKDPSGKVLGILYTGVPKSEFLAGITQTILMVALASFIVTACVGFAAHNALGKTFAPLSQLCGLMERLRSGDGAFQVNGTERRDEIGTIARAIEGFRDSKNAKDQDDILQKQVVEKIGEYLGQLAAGDLTTTISEPFPDAYEPLRRDFNKAVVALGEAMIAVTGAGAAINTGAGEIHQASDDLAQRTERQAMNLSETSSAMSEVTSTVQNTAQNAAMARETIDTTKAEAQKSAEIVAQVVEAMRAIEQSSGEISQIISLIDGIAFQTNLLALNAGVEAARAGETGKGFAVVASEVRSLAQRSAEAAADIKAKISGSAEHVNNGVELVSQAGGTLDRVFNNIDDLNSLIRSIADVSDQQASGLQQINQTISEMNLVTQQNAAMVEQATAAARTLASQADLLTEEMARFRLPEELGARPVGGTQLAPVHHLPDPGRLRTKIAANRSPLAAAYAEHDWAEF